MASMREYTMYIRLPVQDADAEDADDANVFRICDAMEAAGFADEDWDFVDTNDIESPTEKVASAAQQSPSELGGE